MPVKLQRQEPRWTISLEGQITLTSAAELKNLLLERLAAGKDLELDLERAEEIDIAIMQVLCAAAREAARTGSRIACHASAGVADAVRESGFSQSLGFLLQE